ncbi:VCBS domain-containing protein, partial [Hoeflea sp. AS60]|uniref:beta strand repeat-containing protein n=1 Tax=Hoeflea sp. AS60 TaxID=3135780 RepID=UPI00317EDC95
MSVIVPNAENRVTLAADASIEEIQLDGDDLLLIQPDGSQIRIIGGALSVPTFIIGDIEVPQDVLVAALDSNGFNVAAGPGNTLSVSPQAPTGSGGEFEDSSGASIAGDRLQALGLLGDDPGAGNGAGAVPEINDPGNVASVVSGGVSAGEIVESVDNPGGVDADPVLATGSITFFDPDFGETRDAEVTARTVVSKVLDNGGTLTAAQLDALLAGFSLNTPGGITVESTSAAGGAIDWTYLVGNAAVDFLAAGEVITLSFDVRLNDGIFAVTQAVTVTVTGTNDQPVIEGASVLADAIAEQSDVTGSGAALTATGQIVLSDVDLTDTHTTSQAFVSAEWSSGADLSFDPGTLAIGAVNQTADTADWTYTIADNAVDFLAAGETLTITYDVTVQDDSALSDASSAIRQLVVVITGTNDKPVITSGAQDGIVNEQPDLVHDADADPIDVKGTITFDDVELSDQPTAAVTGSEVTTATLANGYVLTAAQQAILLDAFSLDAANGVSNSSFGDGKGEIAWTYDATNAAIDFLGENDELVLTFTVTVDDGHGGTAAQDVTITVNGTNDAPLVHQVKVLGFLVESLDAASGADAEPGVLSSRTLFTDVDLTDAPTASVTTRELTTATLANGYVLTAEKKAAVLDAFKLTDLVDGVADSSFGDGAGQVDWSYDVSNAAIDFLGENDVLQMTFRITVDDGNGGTAESGDIWVYIYGTNDKPVISAVTDVSETLDEADAALSTAGSFDVSDVDTSDIVSITGVTVATSGTGPIAGMPDNAALLAMFGSNSDSVINSLSNTGTVNWTFAADSHAFDYLGDGQTLELTYTVSLSDGNPGTVEQDITITVVGTDDAPEISTPAAVPSTDEDTSLIINGVSVADVDSDTLTVTLTAGHGELSLSGLAGLSFSAGDGTADATMIFTGSVADINAALAGMSFAPTADYTGPAEIAYSVSDGTTAAVTGTIDVDVTPVNDAPEAVIALAPAGGEILVNTATASVQSSQRITALSNGGFVVTWRDYSEGVGGAAGDTSGTAVKAQVFGADGTPTGTEILVNTATESFQSEVQITALSNGGFVVTWHDDSQGIGGATGDTSSYAVKAQMFGADGTAVGMELLVNTATADNQFDQQITALSKGGFVVTWQDHSAGVGGAAGDTSETAVKAQVFGADGTAVGTELLVNTATENYQTAPRITALSNGGFVVTWQDRSQGVGGAAGDTSETAVKAQVFGADGTA